jgi:hypothetical protein
VYTVLVGIVLAVIPFAFLSLLKNNFGRDPARRFVPWLKAAFSLFFLWVSMCQRGTEREKPARPAV